MATTRLTDNGYTIDSGPFAGGYSFGFTPQQQATGGMAPGDPFAYTQGSLLTPWTQAFTPPPGAGSAYAAPFQGAGSFQYGFQAPDAIKTQTIAAPEKFSYADFRQPTAADMMVDPGYQFRLEQGQKALETAQAAKGVLRTGGSLKDLLSYGQDLGSQEYGNVYNRARDLYGLNRANAADARDFNWNSQFQQQAQNAANNLQAQQATAGNSLAASQLGYNVAAGEWDRANALKTQQYDYGRANEDRAYNRALGEYGIARENFQNNQANQFGRLMQMGQLGNPSGYAGAMADLFTGQGNAQAAGTLGAGNAWAGAFSNIGNMGMDAATLWQLGQRPPAPTSAPYNYYGAVGRGVPAGLPGAMGPTAWANPYGGGMMANMPGYVDPSTLWRRT